MASWLRTFTAACLLLMLDNGCIVYEMRDQLKSVNEQLKTVNDQLVKIHTSESTIEVRVTSSEHSMASINESMEPIRISLRRIDDELAGFRQTLQKIDKFVPGKISPDTPPPAPQEPTRETTPQNK